MNKGNISLGCFSYFYAGDHIVMVFIRVFSNICDFLEFDDGLK